MIEIAERKKRERLGVCLDAQLAAPATLAVQSPPARLAPEVRALLARLRRKIRGYVWFEGAAGVLLTACAAYWLLVLVDWWLEPPVMVRLSLLAIAFAMVLVVLYRLVLRRAFVPLRDRSLAILIERSHGDFDETLLTAVELAPRAAETDIYTREMLAQVCQLAAERAASVDLKRVFEGAPLWRKVILPGLLVTRLGFWAYEAGDVFALAARRVTGLSDVPWPRRTALAIDGFNRGEAVVARGADFEIVVKADTAKEVPRSVQIRWTDESGGSRADMLRDGNAIAGQDTHQDFRHSFAAILSPIRFEIRGGDARLRNLSIRVVDSPALEMTLRCEYPAYMRRSAADLPVVGPVAVPRGADVSLLAKANKDLVRVDVETQSDAALFVPPHIDFALPNMGARRLDLPLGKLDADATLLLTLSDADGIRSRRPERLVISIIEDQPPEVGVRLDGIGSAVTSSARLPVKGTVTDDYGVSRLSMVCEVDGGESREYPFATVASERLKIDLDEAFELRDLGLAAGQKLSVGVSAVDNRALSEFDQANTGVGERFRLEVVTEEQLRAILESRELNLRQRFETILEEVTQTRDSLAQLDVLPVSTVDIGGVEAAADASAEDNEANSFERRLGRSQVRVERAAQSCRKNAEETLGTAVAFEDICAEMINNRIDTQELMSRLSDQIAVPLRAAAEVEFPEIEGSLAAIREKLMAGEVDEEAARAAIAKTDRLLVELQRIRDRMLELETFNEAVDQLRAILALQRDLNDRTKKENAAAVLDLLQ